jgi:formylglycine-generating enzyme required for sulfatase activity
MTSSCTATNGTARSYSFCLIVALLGGTACDAAAGKRRPHSQSCPSAMLFVNGGTVIMDGKFSVTLAPFCMDVHEVTVAEYAACVRSQHCSPPQAYQEPQFRDQARISCNWGQPRRDDHPINCVGWAQAHAYCRAIDKELPTEAQWQMAANGGPQERAFPWGNRAPTAADACWDIEQARRQTCPVAEYPATAEGLRDMAGNVSEWVYDWFAVYPSHAGKDYQGPPSGVRRVSRGGAWLTADSAYLRTDVRSDRPADYAGDAVGFRCAKSF